MSTCSALEVASLKTLRISGSVFSGKAEGAKFVSLSWVRAQVKEKIGFDPYNGTLNLRLAKEDCLKLDKALRSAKPIEILPEAGYYLGKCFKAQIKNGLQCAAVIPQTPNYPKNVLELIAPFNLREMLHLRDNDKVEIVLEY